MNKAKKVIGVIVIATSMIFSQIITHATMFTMDFSENACNGINCIRLSSGSSLNMDYQNGQFNYPIKYCINGKDPGTYGELYDKDNKPVLDNGAYIVTSGVYSNENEDAELISDVYTNVCISGNVENLAKQTDEEKIHYEEYTITNGRAPEYIFDGDREYGNINKSFQYENKDITVNYSQPITTNVMLITLRLRETLVPGVSGGSTGTNSDGTTATKIEKTANDASLTIDIRYKNLEGEFVSATGGAKTIIIPKGSNVTFTKAYDYGAIWTTIPVILDKFTSDEIIYSFKSASDIFHIKEVELYETNKKTYNLIAMPAHAKITSSTEITLQGNLESGDSLRYTLDGTTPTNESYLYNDPIRLEDGIKTIKAAFFSAEGTIVSKVFDFRYIVGTKTNIGVQTDSQKIVFNSRANWYGRTPVYAFDGKSNFSNPAEVMTNASSSSFSSWVEVSYDNPVTFDTVAIPVRVSTTETSSGPSTDEVSLKLQIDTYEDDGTTVKDSTTIQSVLPIGSQLTWSTDYGNAMWVYLPTFAFDSFTTKKVRFTVLYDGTSNVVSLKEIEMYNSQQ